MVFVCRKSPRLLHCFRFRSRYIVWLCMSQPRQQRMAGMMTPDRIVDLDARQLSQCIRTRRISCAEVMSAYLAQISRINPTVNAIVSIRPFEDLLANAAVRDRELDRGLWRGVLHGFPFAVKDLADVAGLPTTKGSPIFVGSIAERDSPFVAKLRAAGVVFIGKTNTPEFGLGSQTFNSVFGTTVNAYDQSRCAGGSSGGAAVALATRMVPLADGSDFMGSLRNPAAFNNVIGFRPSIGRVPEPGFMSNPSVVGPMGRTVHDAALLLSVIGGPNRHAPSSIAQDASEFARPLKPPDRRTRVGWIGDLDGYLPMEPGVLRLCGDALTKLEAAGCVVEVARPQMPPELVWESFVAWRHLFVFEDLRHLYRDPRARALLKPEAVWEITAGAQLTASDIVRAHEQRCRWFESVATLLDSYDVLAAPSAQVFPFDAGLRWPAEVDGRPMDTYHRWMEVVAPWSLANLPVLNVPAGFDARGLPMGLQLIGRPYTDLDLLRLGAAYEQASGWTERVRPPLLDSTDASFT